MVCVHDKKMKEAWCLATSRTDLVAQQVVKLYGRRFTIEENFRDTKDLKFGLGLSTTHIGDCQRRDRLLLLVAIAQGLLTLLGAACEETGLDRRLKARDRLAEGLDQAVLRKERVQQEQIPWHQQKRGAEISSRGLAHIFEVVLLTCPMALAKSLGVARALTSTANRGKPVPAPRYQPAIYLCNRLLNSSLWICTRFAFWPYRRCHQGAKGKGPMHLTPREIDKLVLHQAGFLAQKRLARGLRLNHPEAVALIATQILEFIREGRPVAELMDLGRRFLGRAEVMDGIPEMIPDVQVEGTFPDGTKLVTVHHPIVAARGELELALHGSFLPVPARGLFERMNPPAAGPPDDAAIGAVVVMPGEITLNQGREGFALAVENRGDRPIQVGSHFPFIEANRALCFDRGRAYGMRLDIPAGSAVRFEPGERKTIHLVAIAGARVIRGGSALASGPVDEEGRARALAAVIARGFGHQPAAPVSDAVASGPAEVRS